ncbi:cobalamin binding intrinsic factor-like [Pecten maximus]|uniref:cobalamin binding intrinsic factor-like n=1 Tax=Pecten maximus TaxID=6579 RepID=UPI00145873AB|nr:cobalamin binding intrinsic factor-like [Pecten maximus]
MAGFNILLIVLQVINGVTSFSSRASANTRQSLPFYNNRHLLDIAAIQTGSYQLLRARSEWQWGPRSNAEAILGLTLANKRWYQKNNAATYISVKAMELELLAQLSVDKRLKDKNWSKGKLAQYVTALQLTCHNPSKFYRHNLLRHLKGHLKISEEDFRNNRFALSWVVIALCNNQKDIGNTSLAIINDHPGEYKFGVDEASMILMATTCLKELEAKSAAEDFIVEEMRANMSQYNEFTKGLVVQALTAAKTEKVGDIINIARSDLRQAILRTTLLELPGAASHVLPALAKKSYLDASKVVCPEKAKMKTKLKTAAKITVGIDVIDDIIGNTTDSWNVTTRKGSDLLTTMQLFQKRSKNFRFKSTQTSFGRSIISINGVAQDIGNKIFWRIEDRTGVPLANGVSRTIPKDGDSYIFRLSKF